jgi:hypothetical protein
MEPAASCCSSTLAQEAHSNTPWVGEEDKEGYKEKETLKVKSKG